MFEKADLLNKDGKVVGEIEVNCRLKPRKGIKSKLYFYLEKDKFSVRFRKKRS